MNSKFIKGFEKTAGPIGAAVKAVGKKAIGVAGGPLSAAMTGLGALSDYSAINAKMQAARSGTL